MQRSRKIAPQRAHRRRLLDWLVEIGAGDVYAAVDENLWSPFFTDKLRREIEVDASIDLWRPPKWRRVLAHNVKWFRF